jgi:hypothetical protein
VVWWSVERRRQVDKVLSPLLYHSGAPPPASDALMASRAPPSAPVMASTSRLAHAARSPPPRSVNALPEIAWVWYLSAFVHMRRQASDGVIAFEMYVTPVTPAAPAAAPAPAAVETITPPSTPPSTSSGAVESVEAVEAASSGGVARHRTTGRRAATTTEQEEEQEEEEEETPPAVADGVVMRAVRGGDFTNDPRMEL